MQPQLMHIVREFGDHYFVYPISFMIQLVAHHIPGASFGIAIIIMTLVIRSAMIPLAVSQYRSQAKMKKNAT